MSQRQPDRLVSTAPQQPSQDASPAQLEPTVAIKTPHSRKNPAVKTRVITQYAQGKDKTSIAKELGITRNTVRAILKESDVDLHLSTGTHLCVALIPKSVQAIEKSLDKGDGSLGIRLLEGLGVLGEGRSTGKQPVQIELSQAIGIMFKQAQPVGEEPAIEVKNEIGSVSPAGSGPEVQRK